MRAKLVLAAICIAASASAGAAAAHDSDKCYPEWSDAAPIVKRERLVTAKDLHEQARKRHLGEPIRIMLCEEQGRYLYRVVLQDAHGKVRNVTLDARRPF